MARARSGKYFLNLARKRKTVYEFTGRGVKDGDIQKILEAARWAPSCSNAQPWKFIVVKGKEMISRLMGTACYGAFHYDPALLIVLVLDSRLWKESKHRCVMNSKLGTIEAHLSIAMPVLSMALQAEDMGIGSCILTPEQKPSSKILRLKEGDMAPVMIGFGYEKKGAFQKKRERKPLRDLVYHETFGRRAKNE